MSEFWSRRSRRGQQCDGGFVIVFHRCERRCWDEGHYNVDEISRDRELATLLSSSVHIDQVVSHLSRVNARLATLPAIYIGWSAAVPSLVLILLMLVGFAFDVDSSLTTAAGVASLLCFVASVLLFGYYYWRVGSSLDALLVDLNGELGDEDEEDDEEASIEWRRGKQAREDDQLFLIVRRLIDDGSDSELFEEDDALV
jgi:hypothetical protein